MNDRITYRCPSCGFQALAIDNAGWLVCTWVQCKAPHMANELIHRVLEMPSAMDLSKLKELSDLAHVLVAANRCQHSVRRVGGERSKCEGCGITYRPLDDETPDKAEDRLLAELVAGLDALIAEVDVPATEYGQRTAAVPSTGEGGV